MNLYWKIKPAMRKQDEPKSSLMIHKSRRKKLFEWYECNKWGIGYWNHKQKSPP